MKLLTEEKKDFNKTWMIVVCRRQGQIQSSNFVMIEKYSPKVDEGKYSIFYSASNSWIFCNYESTKLRVSSMTTLIYIHDTFTKLCRN